MKKRDLLTLRDFSREEILALLQDSILLKKLRNAGAKYLNLLSGKTVAMIFEKPSTRTRASFTVAAYELGAFPVSYSSNELQLARGEPVKDVARVLSRYHDLIAARVYRHEDLEELARYSSVPVVNLLSDKYHPLQSLADYMTILEKKGKIDGVKITFVGDGTDNVLNSLIIAGVKLGAKITVASPRDYMPREDLVGKEYLSKIQVTEDPYEAVKDADVIYTDVFVSMGQEKEKEARLKAFLPRYQVNSELLKHVGREDFIVMHCLPAHRGEEITDEVVESKNSVVFDQAENRLHTSKAVLLHLLYPEWTKYLGKQPLHQ
ncbi:MULTISPECIES: ornithine carbamoyltransferase [Thermofilum]|uniref:Ornithine carbamoyltransferase n=3 Tax=Thermofilum TaxID=2268 RepID=S5ZDB9_9CREN|nr:ornithine carbamoyltransferase [Thermofilum adornatum]AGT34988.1 ornithine carbamoyltransferase [Thermofilum adornatum]AJB42717.1 Ornithine carbamoyltransferase [Thermofilum adornatum 1505]